MGKILGLIPARGGSRSIPRKNLALLGGKPLIAWTIECACACSLLDRIIVSTDDTEIAQTARQLGVDVPFMRPPDLAQDDTPMLAVIQHAVTAMEAIGGPLDIVVLLQPTSPLRSVADIEACLSPVLAGEVPAAITVCQVEHSPFYGMGTVVDDRWVLLFPEHVSLIRRQDAPVVYRETGAVCVFSRTTVMGSGTLSPPGIRPVVVPASRSVDIDSPLDILIAEGILR